MKRISFLIQLLLLSIALWSQERITISGFVTDIESGEALIGATVYETTNKQGCISNEFGFYSLTIEGKASHSITASFIGYTTLVKLLDQKSKIINFTLKPGLELSEVVVQFNNSRNNSTENINAIKMNISDVKKQPSVFGENDLIQAIQLLPGIQSGGEGKSQLFVRGGSPDQNLILLDDVPLYYISHFGGFFSVFNSDAINNVEITKGGFPARYGGRLSSVLDIRMKEGNLKHFDGNCTVGLLSSRITLEGPIKTDKSSYLISVRKSILPLMKIVSKNIGNGFYDLNGKINFKLTEKDRLLFSLYAGNDAVNTITYDWESENVDPIFSTKGNWGNLLASMRWNHVFSNQLFTNLTLSTIDYKYKSTIFTSVEKEEVQYETTNYMTSGITDINVTYDLKWFANPNYSLRAGLKSTIHFFMPNNESMHQTASSGFSADTLYSSNMKAFENSFYLENEFTYKLFSGNLGGRLVNYNEGKNSFLYFEPRVLLNFELSKMFKINASYSQMNQFVHLLSYSNAGFPNDYWMPATGKAVPEFSDEYSIGLDIGIMQNKFKSSIVAYTKTMENLVAFKNGASLFGNFESWETVVEKDGLGSSKGLELMFQKLKGSTTGWISTTVSKSTRQFANINGGEVFPFKYDRKLDISVVVNQQINEKVQLSFVWNYGTGYPVTLAAGKYQFKGEEETIIWANRNSSRMRDYHRLDIAVQFPYTIGQLDGQFSISIMNVYNRKNPYYYYYSNESGRLKLYQQSLFPFFPSFSYSFQF